MDEIKIKWLVISITSVLTYLFGAVTVTFKALLLFIAVDYLSGVAAAWWRGELSSKIGTRGIVKKFMLLSLVLVAHWLDQMFGAAGATRQIALYMICGNELISFSENLEKIGIRIPNPLRDKFKQLAGGKKV